ncbi:MAG: hypothetical protein IJH04_08760 [Eggerthellaceae bacterium]|nr:hypothetical protein [Eggerthellaceae bacterium]
MHDTGHPHHHHDHGAESPEKRLALLAYMVDHNASHVQEMKEAAEGVDGEAKQLIDEAAALLEQGNAKLAQALDVLKGE